MSRIRFLLTVSTLPAACLLLLNSAAAAPRRDTRKPAPASQSRPASKGDQAELDSGWKALAEWQPEEAIRRFRTIPQNQATNFRLAWGYGVAYGQLSNFPESEKWFERAEGHYSQNSRLLTDFGFTYMSWGLYGARTAKKAEEHYDSARYFDAAESKFLGASRLAPTDSLPFTRLAMLSFYRGQYPQAWKYVKKSRQLGGEELDSRFLSDLAKRLPEPA